MSRDMPIEDGGVLADQALVNDAPAGHRPSGFDPSRCQWCDETGFDLRGLAHHVWSRCEVVEKLANENIADNAAWHKQMWEAAQARRRDSDGNPEGGDGTAPLRSNDSAGLQGIAPTLPESSS